MNLFEFIPANKQELYEQTLEHLGLTFLSLSLAVLLAVPLGIVITRQPRWAGVVLGITGVLQTIPSLALLGFLIPLLGIGFKPAILVLFLYALLPILRNTYTGICEVDAAVKEAAAGMGMTPWQVLTKVELPLAMPVIFAGIRTATVINVGVATLAAYIGAGGLGEFIFGGIVLNNANMILSGALFAAVLAVVFDQLLALVNRIPLRRMLRTSLYASALVPIMSLLYFVPQWSSSGLSIGADPEFAGRADGYPKLAALYGLHLNTKILNAGLMYRAVAEGEMDVISGYSTDGRIKAYDLLVLEDDLHAFPPYECAPLVNKNVINNYPEVIRTLELLKGKINDSIMTVLNYQVDFEQKKPEAVATQFLKDVKLWREDVAQGGKVLRIGSKIFTEQYILAHLFAQLINGYTNYDVEVKTGLGGTKVCFDALRTGAIDVYPEYTGTGFQVLLTPTAAEMEQLITDAPALYQYVDQAFMQQYGIDWLAPLGFSNTYALVIRQAMAKEAKLKTISDLARVRK
ncbi:MAG: ABC transporter permease/substrate-binding protein [Saprospiraceae bacterium]